MDDRPITGPSGTGKRASLFTLGCRLNQAETRLLEERLRAAGYEIVPFGARAHLGVIHTCVVTREAEAKSRKYIHRFLRENPGAVVAVIGCYAQTAAATIAGIDGVDLVLGNDAKLLLPEFLDGLERGAPVVICGKPVRQSFKLPFLAQGPPITRRVNLKIQDGCDLMCSYCYIPFARGRSRSRVFEDALAEAGILVRRGAKELVLTGVNIGDYEDNGRGLIELVDVLSTLSPRPRIRISSIELTNLPEALLERMADPNHALAPHLHVPLQSGSDAILKSMRRTYTASEYLAFMKHAAQVVPGIGLGADVMVGFPGETDADFQATCELIEQSPLFHLHIFQYSERLEVMSARLPDKISPQKSKVRSELLHCIATEKKRQFQTSQLGQIRQVLFENRQGDFWLGHTDNYLDICALSPESLENSFAWLSLREIRGKVLFGVLSGK